MVSVQAPEGVEQARVSDETHKIVISNEMLHVQVLNSKIEPETLTTADFVRASIFDLTESSVEYLERLIRCVEEDSNQTKDGDCSFEHAARDHRS